MLCLLRTVTLILQTRFGATQTDPSTVLKKGNMYCATTRSFSFPSLPWAMRIKCFGCVWESTLLFCLQIKVFSIFLRQLYRLVFSRISWGWALQNPEGVLGNKFWMKWNISKSIRLTYSYIMTWLFIFYLYENRIGVWSNEMKMLTKVYLTCYCINRIFYLSTDWWVEYKPTSLPSYEIHTVKFIINKYHM